MRSRGSTRDSNGLLLQVLLFRGEFRGLGSQLANLGCREGRVFRGRLSCHVLALWAVSSLKRNTDELVELELGEDFFGETKPVEAFSHDSSPR